MINANKGASHENLIRVLNPVIRGWANYHRHISANADIHVARFGRRIPRIAALLVLDNPVLLLYRLVQRAIIVAL